MKKLASVLSIVMIVFANVLTFNVFASYGGGTASSINIDYCPHGDYSGSYYDGTCDDTNTDQNADQNTDTNQNTNQNTDQNTDTNQNTDQNTDTNQDTNTDQNANQNTDTGDTGTSDSGSQGPSLYDLLKNRNTANEGSVGNNNPNYNPSTEVSGENGFTLPGMLAPTGASL